MKSVLEFCLPFVFFIGAFVLFLTGLTIVEIDGISDGLKIILQLVCLVGGFLLGGLAFQFKGFKK